MRRRKGTRGRPRKVKKGRITRLTESLNLESKLSEDNLSEQALSLKSDDAVTPDFIGLDKTGPYSYRVGSVNIELESSEEDIKPEILENDIVLEVECGSNTAKMYLSRLCQGSKGSCILFDEAWLTPNEFQFVSGRETAKDWKRSIRHFGRSLKLLMTKGILTVHPAACRCDSCRLLTSSTNEPKLVKEKRQRDRERASRGSEGSASGSDKEDASPGSEEEASEEADDESRGSEENGVGESGSSSDDEGEEGEEENVEENNNVTEEKAESSASGSSSSSDSSDSESEEDNEEAEEKEEKMEESEEKVENDEMSSEIVSKENVAESEQMEVEEDVEEQKTEKDKEFDTRTENTLKEAVEDIPSNDDEITAQQTDDDTDNVTEMESRCVNDDASETEPENDHSQELPLKEDVPENKDTNAGDNNINGNEGDTEDNYKDNNKNVYDKKEESQESNNYVDETDAKTLEDESNMQVDETEHCSSNFAREEVKREKGEVVESQKDENKTEKLSEEHPTNEAEVFNENGSENKSVEAESIDVPPSAADPSPTSSQRATPTLPEFPLRKSVERTNSTGGKSRLSNIIDLLRTSKEKETQKHVVVEKQEERPPERRKPDVSEIRQVKEVREVKDNKVPSPVPARREEPRPRKPEKEPQIPRVSKDEAKVSQNLHEAMRYPMGHLPFGFPPPEMLERASREAHEQLSKSHRQFEKNLESLIAQNMNPFIPELSMFSLPEHRAQMEYNYLKNMERLDQMAKGRMMTMAEIRHQQLLQEHNSFVAKLAEQQKAALKAEERAKRDVATRSVAPLKKSSKEQSLSHTKVPHAHRAMPEPRKDKPDNKTLQSPPAAHHHQPSSRPPSTGSKLPSSLPLPATSSSNSRAAYPSSSLQSRSSPMIAPVAPPLQMWSSCFPYVIPPPNMEMQRLTQFFPNLNGGIFSPETGTRRNSESPILDLSTKKRKGDYKDDESRSKMAKLSSNYKNVSASHTNGHSRDNSLSSHSNEALSAKNKPSWANMDRNNVLKCTCALQHLNDIRTWSVDDVCCFLKGLEGCTSYTDTFRRNGIDGNTLMLLTSDFLTKSLGMRTGAAKFLTESVSRRARELQKLVPCDYCRIKNQKG